jgi:hypothetical protein
MSIWTHVAGAMSLDVHESTLNQIEQPIDIVNRLTGSWPGDSWHEKLWPNCIETREGFGGGPPLPSGSEGPMYFYAKNIGSLYSSNNCLVSFEGNLRNYGEHQIHNDLIPYFSELLKRYNDNHINIRTMAIAVESRHIKLLLSVYYDDSIGNRCVPSLRLTVNK